MQKIDVLQFKIVELGHILDFCLLIVNGKFSPKWGIALKWTIHMMICGSYVIMLCTFYFHLDSLHILHGPSKMEFD